MEPTLADLQERLRAFRDERDWRQFHNPKDLAAAIAIEAAELQEFFLWTDPEEAARVAQNKREGVEAELADVLIQCLNFADVAEIDVLEAIQAKLRINAEKYPIDRARGNARKARDL